MASYPSGQRELTVNQPFSTSGVRIPHLPPNVNDPAEAGSFTFNAMSVIRTPAGSRIPNKAEPLSGGVPSPRDAALAASGPLHVVARYDSATQLRREAGQNVKPSHFDRTRRHAALAALLVIPLTLSLSGCFAVHATSGRSSSHASDVVTPIPQPQPSAALLSAVSNIDTDLDTTKATTLVVEQACTDLSSTFSQSQMVSYSLDSVTSDFESILEISPSKTAKIIHLAATEYCPKWDQ